MGCCPPPPQDGVSTNSTTSAGKDFYVSLLRLPCQGGHAAYFAGAPAGAAGVGCWAGAGCGAGWAGAACWAGAVAGAAGCWPGAAGWAGAAFWAPLEDMMDDDPVWPEI